jgi:hypothetical protein
MKKSLLLLAGSGLFFISCKESKFKELIIQTIFSLFISFEFALFTRDEE